MHSLENRFPTKRVLHLLPLLVLAGCVSTATHIVTAPVHAVGWTVDKMTTSQAEADRNRGRREREADERRRKEDKKAAKRQREEEKRRQRMQEQEGGY
jgi:DNA-binding helix-hairpin-helix protein with protein kinase domain